MNHFTQSSAITTKVGLTNSLKNLIWFKNIDIDTIYPRCFDFTQPEAVSDFTEEFKAVKAQSVLQTYVREMRNAYEKQINKGNCADISSQSVSEKVLDVALKVSERRLRDIDEMLDNPEEEVFISDDEWNILNANKMKEENGPEI